MAQAPAQVARPRLLQLALAGVAVASALAGLGFANLYFARANAPVTLLSGAERLAETLEKSPWISVGSDGPAIWALTGPCDACTALATEDLPALEAAGYDVRVIFVAPADASAADRVRAVDLARARAGAQGDLEPGEAEGYLAWGQRTEAEIADILRANGAEPQVPVLLWRRGPEWRAQLGRPPALRANIQSELGPAA